VKVACRERNERRRVAGNRENREQPLKVRESPHGHDESTGFSQHLQREHLEKDSSGAAIRMINFGKVLKKRYIEQNKAFQVLSSSRLKAPPVERNKRCKMKLVGVDVYVWSNEIPKMPDTVGPFALKMISNSGTRIYPPPAPHIDCTDWFQCRYLAPGEVGHGEVDQFLSTISKNFVWTKAQKLYQQNGANLFSEPY
jgi:hypothetical protein